MLVLGVVVGLSIVHELIHGLFAVLQGGRVYGLKIRWSGVYMKIDIPDNIKHYRLAIINTALAPIILAPIAFWLGVLVYGYVFGGWVMLFTYLTTMFIDFLCAGAVVSGRVEKVYIWLLRKLKVLGDE